MPGTGHISDPIVNGARAASGEYGERPTTTVSSGVSAAEARRPASGATLSHCPAGTGSVPVTACACSSAVARRSSACCEALSLTVLAAVSATSFLATCFPVLERLVADLGGVLLYVIRHGADALGP